MGANMIDRTLPYYKWFWQDWRANRKIQRMSYIERGLYRELLDECWVEGCIPNDIKELADICGCPEDVMADAWQVLSSCFELLEDGRLINQKLHSLRTEKDVERLKKSENGKKGGLAKAIGKQVPSNCHIEDKIKEDKKREKIATPEGVSESTFKDFLKLRKAKRLPWTETVEKSFTKEAEKLKWTMQQVIEYCCKKGWAGFEASWVKDELTANNQSNDKSWMFSNEGIVAKANELGVRSEGLSYQQLKDKCVFVMTQRSLQ
jgi:uncharacterized protein YdaU (DUF1376 family)